MINVNNVFKNFVVFVLCGINLNAQVAHNTNIGITARKVFTGILADVTYNTTYIMPPFADVTDRNDPIAPLLQDLYNKTKSQALSLVSRTIAEELAKNTAYSTMISNWGTYIGWAGLTLAAYDFALSLSQSLNTQYRLYKVQIPAWGQYKFTFNLKGDVDNPKNTIKIFRKEMSLYYFENSMSSDGVAVYDGLWLGEGEIYVVVGLDNQSVLLHTAGSLNLIESFTPMSWDSTLIIAENNPGLTASLPSIGSSANIVVNKPSDVYENSIKNISFGVGTMQFKNIRPYVSAILSPFNVPDYKIQQIYDGGGHVWDADIRQNYVTYSNGSAIFNVTRLADTEVGWY